jgi:hypothetical protein
VGKPDGHPVDKSLPPSNHGRVKRDGEIFANYFCCDVWSFFRQSY